MKTPGDALLEFIVRPEGPRRTALDMVSRFLPRGLAGLAYWYVLLPTHRWLFEGMLRAVARRTGRRVLEGPYEIPVEDTVTCRL